MQHCHLTILTTTSQIPHSHGLIKYLDQLDRLRLKQNPNLTTNRDWQNSRYLKQLAYLRNYHILSLSHRKGHAALLCSPFYRKNLNAGIDIEEMQQRDFCALCDFFCSATEQTWLKDQDNIKLAFYTLWTLKEALIKAHNRELADMKKFSLIHADGIHIPVFHNLLLSGFSFQLPTDWIVSGVYPTHKIQPSLTIQCYGNWQHANAHNNHIDVRHWPSRAR